MTTDFERRLTAGLHRLADAYPVAAPPADHLRARLANSPRTRPLAAPRGWSRPALAAAAVLAVLVAVALLPGFDLPGGRLAPSGTATAPMLPARFAGLSLLTATVSTAPPGPAVALYDQGALGTRLGTSQLLVLGADGRTYRRLDLAEDGGGRGADGEWQPALALLAPDGTRVAVADTERLSAALHLVDLRSGAARAFPLGQRAVVRPLAWSPDGSRLVIALLDEPPNGTFGTGRLAVLDVRDGQLHPVGTATLTDVLLVVAVSPDGALLAVPTHDGGIDVLDFTGTVRRHLAVPSGYRLTSSAAWSPDGRMLAVERLGAVPGGLAFLDATGARGPVPAPLAGPADPTRLLGWASDTAVLTGVDGGDYEIVERSVDGASTRTLARIPQGVGRLARVNQVQLAGGLLGELRIADVGGADRGPWPRWFLVLLTAAIAITGWQVNRLVRQRRTGLRSAADGP